MIGREDTGTLSTNHMRAFRPSISKANTGFKGMLRSAFVCQTRLKLS
jgi:hypothetical protein